MVNESLNPDGNAESGTNALPSSSALPMDSPTKASKGVVLNQPSFFLVQRAQSADNPDALECPVLVGPNHAGLDFFERFDEVKSIWFVRMTPEGLLKTECVQHLCRWWFCSKRDGTYLTALICKSGAMFVVDDDQVYEIDQVTTKWFAGSNFKFAGKQDAFTVNAVVVATNEPSVVTIRSDDGIKYSITRDTFGVSLEALEVGTRVQCLVPRMQRVLSANILEETNIHASESRPIAEQTDHG